MIATLLRGPKSFLLNGYLNASFLLCLWFTSSIANAGNFISSITHYTHTQPHPTSFSDTVQFVSIPSKLYTHSEAEFQWKVVEHATYYEVWLNGLKTITTSPSFIWKSINSHPVDIKVRACNQTECGPFLERLQYTPVKRLEIDHSANEKNNNILWENQNFIITATALLENDITFIDVSINDSSWVRLEKNQATFTGNLGPISSGAHIVTYKINGNTSHNEQITVYAKPNKAVTWLSVSGDSSEFDPTISSLSVPENSGVTLHWQPSEQVSTSVYGYYKLLRNGESIGFVRGTPSYLKHKYQDHAMHWELNNVGSEGVKIYSILPCNQIGAEMNMETDCGPAKSVTVYSGLQAGSFYPPTAPVTNVSVSTQDHPFDSVRKTVRASTEEPLYLHFSPHPDIQDRNGFYRILRNGQPYALWYRSLPYLDNRFGGDYIHTEYTLKQEGIHTFAVTVCGFAKKIEASEQSIICGPPSPSVDVSIYSPYPLVEIKYNALTENRNVYDTESFILSAKQTGGADIQSFKARLNDGDWHTMDYSETHQLFTHDFGKLTKGQYKIEFMLNNRLSEVATFNVDQLPITKEIEFVGVSDSIDNTHYGRTSIQLPAGKVAYLNWQHSNEIPHSPPGYYTVGGTSMPNTFVSGTGGQMQFELPISAEKLHTFWIKACKQIGTYRNPSKDCGPQRTIYVDATTTPYITSWSKRFVRVGEPVDLVFEHPDIFECNVFNDNKMIITPQSSSLEIIFYAPIENNHLTLECVDIYGDMVGYSNIMSPPITILPLKTPIIRIKY
ncbi:hypothetical protein OE749_06410 [Aestuariibacter sp. AA17]|uniref:Uncharacterized protein n=1 Tax=Fluctibacter corallii TaxID=2984329 RepID=A0ABT3A6L2_9ALTE|nr:hypothetical protein [Aestuariibacter sp. AA17]MCV2884322.1 hypothetical protein [Aestuariibacter sp. AA17]